MRVAVIGGNGKTGRAVRDALGHRGVESRALGRAEWPDLAAALTGCDAASRIAPNRHPDEPAYVAHALEQLAAAGVDRVVYHSVASPYAPAMPHHVGKARGEDLVRTSGTRWTSLQPGAYLQNLDLTGTVRVPYAVDVPFGFLDLADLGEAAATVLLEDGHDGATYELASRVATVAELAADAGVSAERVEEWHGEGRDGRETAWLRAMFDYYDRHGLLVGTLPLAALLHERRVSSRR
jgi:uncharacterized protein YbjT (DUF2867 family)